METSTFTWYPKIVENAVDYVKSQHALEAIDTISNSLSRSLAGWWRFREGTGRILYDASGNKYHGTIYGAEWKNKGKDEQELHFDGQDDYAEIKWKGPLQGENTSFTFAFQVQTDGKKGNNWVVGDNSGYSHFFFGLKNGKPCIHWRYNDSWTNYELTADTTITGNKAHIAATYEASTGSVIIYIDGAPVASDTKTKPKGIKDIDTLLIGAGYPGAVPEYFKGSIDEVMIFKKALSRKEIYALYKGKKPIMDTQVPSVPGCLTVNTSGRQIHLSWD